MDPLELALRASQESKQEKENLDKSADKKVENKLEDNKSTDSSKADQKQEVKKKPLDPLSALLQEQTSTDTTLESSSETENKNEDLSSALKNNNPVSITNSSDQKKTPKKFDPLAMALGGSDDSQEEVLEEKQEPEGVNTKQSQSVKTVVSEKEEKSTETNNLFFDDFDDETEEQNSNEVKIESSTKEEVFVKTEPEEEETEEPTSSASSASSESIEEKVQAIQAELEQEVSQNKFTTDEIVGEIEEASEVDSVLESPTDEQETEELPIEDDEVTEIEEDVEDGDTESSTHFDRKDLSNEMLIHLYQALLKPRLIEERMLIALRQGKITKWFSGFGQEAISVGIAEAVQKDEYLLPLHRNLGLFTSRGINLEKLFAQFQGKKNGFTKGRDRSFHFGTNEHHIVGMISHLGPQLAVANGISLADMLENKERITVTFTGDGGTSEGDFHEAMNVAAVWNLPTLFVVENNGYGLSTPSHEQFRCKQFVDKGIGYGMEAVQVDGNNILEVYHTVKELSKKMRNRPHPVLLEAITFRMRGHEEASGTKYVPQELFEVWKEKDPVQNYEQYLLEEGVLTGEQIEKIRKEFFEEIKEALDAALAQDPIQPNTAEELIDMYALHEQELIAPISGKQTEKRFVDAISDGLRQSMEKYSRMTIMGQDVADYGGVFKITEGFAEEFGKERVRNTPLCESAIVGAGLGLSIRGWKSVIEMQFADFVTCGFNQIVNNLAKSHYRWGQNADVVVRMPTGAGVAAGPYHSQSNEAWFFHTPGLKVVYPSSPYEAKGLLNAAIEDPNPVIFFEHKALYRSISEEIYDDYYTLPIGKANLVQEGYDVSIITYGMGVHWAKKAAEELGETYSLEIVDLRSLLPWDREAVRETTKKNGKVIILHEDCLTGGIGGEIAAWIAEHCFTDLDAPVMREGSLDTAVPFNANLEQNFLPYHRFLEKLKVLVNY